MASLVHTPFSEITATLELLGVFGVTPDDLAAFRGLKPAEQAKRVAGLLGMTKLELMRVGRAVEIPAVGYFHTGSSYTSDDGTFVHMYPSDSFKRRMFSIEVRDRSATTIRLMTVTSKQFTYQKLLDEAGGPEKATINLYELKKVIEAKVDRGDVRPCAAFVETETGILVFVTARPIPGGWALTSFQIDKTERSSEQEFQLLVRA